MSPWVALAPAAATLAVGSWLSYQRWAKEAGWFPWALVALCVANGWLWSWAARRASSDRELYSVSVAWDVATLAAYNLLPLALSGVRLSPAGWVGFALVVAGAAMVKWSGN